MMFWCYLAKVCSYGEEEGRAAFINSTPSLCFKGCYAPLTLKTTTTAASGGFHETFACFGTSTTVEERLLNEKSVVGKRRHTSFTSNHERNNKQLRKNVPAKKWKEQQKKSDKFPRNVDLMHWISSKSKWLFFLVLIAYHANHFFEIEKLP